MKYLKIKVNGKTENISIPMSWADVPFSLYREMAKCEDGDELFKTTLNLSNEVAESENIIDLYYEARESKVFNTKPSKGGNVVVYNDETVTLVKDVLSYSILQYEDTKVLMSNTQSQEDEINAMRDVFCIYLYPLVSKEKYDYNKAMELREYVDSLPCEVVIDRAGFFLSKLQRRKKYWSRAYQLLKRTIRGRKQVMEN